MFPDGRIEEFIEAQSVSAQLMATPEVAVSIAAAMAHFHFSMLKHFTMLDHLPSCMSPVAQIWDRLRDWARITNELYKPQELEQYQLDHIRDEVRYFAMQALCCVEEQGDFHMLQPANKSDCMRHLVAGTVSDAAAAAACVIQLYWHEQGVCLV